MATYLLLLSMTAISQLSAADGSAVTSATSSSSSGSAAGVDSVKIVDERLAAQWLEEFEVMASVVFNEDAIASWNYNVNITEYNQKLQADTSLRRSLFVKQAYINASRFDFEKFNDTNLKRQFRKVTEIGYSVLPEKDISRADHLRSTMQALFSTSLVCRPATTATARTATNTTNSTTCFALEPELRRIMSTSRDWDELVWAWRGWRDVIGPATKDTYTEFVALMNKAAVLNGYRDLGEYWRSWYEMDDFSEECDRLWDQVKPLYQHLHAYVRRKLKETYSKHKQKFPSSGHLPAHLTGNMWAQTWSNIYDLVIPYKDFVEPDITAALVQQNYNISAMVHLADDFFISLGLDPMPESFWTNSMFEKPTDGRSVVCHASAWDFSNRQDFRIKQCTDVTEHYLETTHHEMGHVQYYLMYKPQPIQYRKGANPGFHEAVGDVMTLSVNTPEHLHKIGLISTPPSANVEADINFLMKQALEKVAFLPFGYLVDKWRWSVFDNSTTEQTYNKDWWKLRCKFQGLSPPVARTENDFDAASKFHVQHNTPYIRYFVSFIIQFQFHQSLCKAANNSGPLHRCDIYQSKEAGRKLRAMLSMGSSRPWPDAMQNLTGTRVMDAQPLLDYFDPLYRWLQKQNKGYDVTWQDECPNSARVLRATAGIEQFVNHVIITICIITILV